MNKEFSENFLKELSDLVDLKANQNESDSYTASLVNGKLSKVTQKVGEEAVEVVIAALAEDKGRVISESCDLLYHLLCLFKAKNVSLEEIRQEMSRRNHSNLDKVK
ncbi:MAG: phosphoribosyl-ATP diphosphatase [Rickettsiales bacterium]|nr:phosphoribosyl-ATP diphosphatase [Rickettsiales bacterium]